ncbi:hypothetical protein FB45DRAFT_1050655 [Roridomyces roridus]|uniref:Alpha-type protein kinase domain-containing protein n=1 Tax=Roridomyces roridus TaxID=1738132 RepID=A0AAD7CJY9_9AGAR|nr:hypothetical protein FB45DRAFT_1050655 [Roridomyces roridus]
MNPGHRDSGFVAEFSMDQPTKCPVCNNLIDPNSNWKFFGNANGDGGKRVCAACAPSVMKRPTTQRRGDAPMPTLAPAYVQDVRGTINAARAKGASQEMRHITAVPSGQGAMGPPPLPPRANTNGTGVSVVVRNTWRQDQASNMHSYPPPAPPAGGAYGYSSNHAQYHDQRRMWSNTAYAAPSVPPQTSVPLVKLRFQLMRSIRGKKIPHLIGNIIAGVPGVPADSTIASIREKGQKALALKIKAELHGYALDWNMIELQELASSVDLETFDAQMNGAYLYSHCVKSTGKGKEGTWTFKKSAVELAFVLGWKQWEDIEDFLDRQERQPPMSTCDDNDANVLSDSEDSATSTRLTSAEFSKKRSRTASISEPTTPPPSKQRRPVFQSPDQARLLSALQNGGSSKTQLKMSQQTQTKPENITYYPIEVLPLEDLIAKGADGFSGFTPDPRRAVQGVLHTSDQYIGRGTFKTAQLAYLTLVSLATDGVGSQPNQCVVLKRPYTNGKQVGEQFEIARFGPQEEYRSILMEANVFQWSSTLHAHTDSFVSRQVVTCGRPTFPLPEIRFVSAGVAVVHSAGGFGQRKVVRSFLVEELIPDHELGFTKFICNSSAVPLVTVLSDPNTADVAEYLAFTQHVQYSKTGGMAYLSDLQGSTELLTDTQIMTNPDKVKGERLFGDGNDPGPFRAFSKQHKCTKYCIWARLTPFEAPAEG